MTQTIKADEIKESGIINSIIGQGSELKGEFKFEGVLRIDGVFAGELKSDGKVIIGQTGHVKTDIKSGTIVIGGLVEGNVYATKQVILLASAQLLGDIITPSLIVEEGVIFDGNCIINKDGNKEFFSNIKKELDAGKGKKVKKNPKKKSK
ncbi:MAG: polymer-forming cytoskeletal protein [Spirochaetes bacterium]|nr:polymer-forming cytoskeletal protein [Spirochaetota bacterium]